jgi:hypothetical protein
MREKWPKLTGIAVGICLLLLAFSVLMAMGFFTVPVLVAFFPFLFLASAAVISLVSLVFHKGHIPALPLWGVSLVVLVGWPICASSPVAIAASLTRRDAALEVPIMAGIPGVSLDVYWDEPGRATFEFRTAYPEQAVRDFYRQQLLARGWTEVTETRFRKGERGIDILYGVHYVGNIGNSFQKFQNQASSFPYEVEVYYYR